MNQTAIFWPMLAQVALVFGVYGVLFLRRRQAVTEGSATSAQFRDNRDEPRQSLSARNNLANQFELPTLFYPACLGLYGVGAADLTAVVLAWLFVVTRYLHAAVHLTSNSLRYRSPVFGLGYVVLGAMWLWLALHLLGWF